MGTKNSLTAGRRRRRERAEVVEYLLPMSEIFVSLEQSRGKEVKNKKRRQGDDVSHTWPEMSGGNKVQLSLLVNVTL